MDKKELLQNGIIIPAIVGIVLAVVLCLFLNSNINQVLPVPQNTAFAFHDSSSVDADKEVDWENLEPNTSIGSVEIGSTKLDLCYEADYSNLVGSVSVSKESTALDKVGCAYLKTNFANAKLLDDAKSFSVNSDFGNHKYKLVDKLEFENEFQAKIYAPSIPKSLVVYYQASNGAGLTSNYNALVFEEV